MYGKMLYTGSRFVTEEERNRRKLISAILNEPMPSYADIKKEVDRLTEFFSIDVEESK